jgi:hypothetical protein
VLADEEDGGLVKETVGNVYVLVKEIEWLGRFFTTVDFVAFLVLTLKFKFKRLLGFKCSTTHFLLFIV